jgi:hypothetical protein
LRIGGGDDHVDALAFVGNLARIERVAGVDIGGKLRIDLGQASLLLLAECQIGGGLERGSRRARSCASEPEDCFISSRMPRRAAGISALARTVGLACAALASVGA